MNKPPKTCDCGRPAAIVTWGAPICARCREIEKRMKQKGGPRKAGEIAPPESETPGGRHPREL